MNINNECLTNKDDAEFNDLINKLCELPLFGKHAADVEMESLADLLVQAKCTGAIQSYPELTFARDPNVRNQYILDISLHEDLTYRIEGKLSEITSQVKTNSVLHFLLRSKLKRLEAVASDISVLTDKVRRLLNE